MATAKSAVGTVPEQRSSSLVAAPGRVPAGRLAEVVTEVWTALIGSPLAIGSGQRTAADLVGTISLLGAEHRTVLLAVPHEVAVSCALALFGLELDELSDVDVHDGFGELLNAVGAAVQALDDEPAWLGLPSVMQGRRLLASLPGATLAFEAEFMTVEGSLRASIWRPSSDAVTRPVHA